MYLVHKLFFRIYNEQFVFSSCVFNCPRKTHPYILEVPAHTIWSRLMSRLIVRGMFIKKKNCNISFNDFGCAFFFLQDDAYRYICKFV